ncbi:lysophospholipid acyltransferase family protein [Adhaeribacter rhizoryzae]|uniref:Phospholipid/glycerol acyltransferase domain-containing protein n=1 Tax=Adhaeribacter rhizoryzae TaxID=2607907 RepID=A0A5M6DQX7_9BACT|nr:lysophospholipid acyltransferase family protein [Adhaeribacter rhizoryzae]KAA5547865.1 hypothetical protein F0145_07975 [Adhaeribacter rhizoryzae]
MLYKFLQKFMRLVLRVYFRKIFLTGTENIPTDKPVLLACNHPNSFMDAVLLAVLLPEPLHFLARADVFNTPLKRWFLQKINLIPIYRLQEGAENLHRNEETFAQCYAILKNNGRILIFSEGLCILEKRLRPLKKGTARLAFGAEVQNNFNLNLQVVPIGLNYTYPEKFREEVMISIGEPIPVKTFERSYYQQPSRAILALNQQLTTRLIYNMVIIPEKEKEPAVEQLLTQHRLSSKVFNNNIWLVCHNNWLTEEQKVVAGFMANAKLAPAAPLNLTIKPEKVQELNIVDQLRKLTPKYLLLFLLLLPFYVLGWLLNILPLKMAQNIARQKVKYIEFYSSVLMVMGMVFYLLYWFCLTAFGLFFSGEIALLFFFLLPLSGYAALHYRDKLEYLAAKAQLQG